ncbi:hypothetical protein J6590_056378 [Homalodisca vitripennis]|nr:hypothetical protein J6590_056378 [Homalodisca vitripennis]
MAENSIGQHEVDKLRSSQAKDQCLAWHIAPAATLEANRTLLKDFINHKVERLLDPIHNKSEEMQELEDEARTTPNLKEAPKNIATEDQWSYLVKTTAYCNFIGNMLYPAERVVVRPRDIPIGIFRMFTIGFRGQNNSRTAFASKQPNQYQGRHGNMNYNRQYDTGSTLYYAQNSGRNERSFHTRSLDSNQSRNNHGINYNHENFQGRGQRSFTNSRYRSSNHGSSNQNNIHFTSSNLKAKGGH